MSTPSVQIIHAPTFNAFREELETHDKEEIFDNSALELFMLCARKYLYQEGWRLEIDADEPDYLTMGSAIHEFQYTYDLTGSFDEALRSFVHRCKAPGTHIDTTLDVTGKTDQEYSVEWGAWLLQNYVDTYPKDKEEFEILTDADGKPYLEVGFAIDADEGVYCGRIDKVVRARFDGPVWKKGNIFIVDHKTTKRPLNDSFLKKFNPNNQLTGYMWAVHELTGVWPTGAIINGIRVYQFQRGTEESVKEKIFTRCHTHRTPSQILERADQIRWTMKVIKEAKKIYRETGKLFPFWQNAPHACTAYFGCGFGMLCKAQTEDLVKLLAKSNFRKRLWVAYSELEQTKRYEIIKVRAS